VQVAWAWSTSTRGSPTDGEGSSDLRYRLTAMTEDYRTNKPSSGAGWVLAPSLQPGDPGWEDPAD
jgi:hypothetical protein